MRSAIVIAAFVASHSSALAALPAEDLFVQGQAAYDRSDFAPAVDRW